MVETAINRAHTTQTADVQTPARVFVLLPAYNEEMSIEPLVDRLETLSKSLQGVVPILVDDGSSDDTFKNAQLYGERVGMKVLQHEKNSGLGATILTGLQHVCNIANNNDRVVLLDADNTHDPNHVPGMLHLIDEGADVVIASRYAPGGKEIGLNPFRKMGSRMVSVFLSVLFRVPHARDYTCGFRAYRVSTLRRAFDVYQDKLITETSFVCMAELLVKLDSVGAKVAEFPLVLRYDLKGGPSKLNIPKTVMRYLWFAATESARIRRTKAAHARATHSAAD